MRQEIKNIYKFHELSEDQKQQAIENYRSRYANDIHWQDELLSSLKAIFEHSGVKLADYELGAHCHSWLKPEFSNDDIEEISGSRAMAWLENNLLDGLRVSYYGKNRNKLRKYGKDYYAGRIKPGPFTGYCADEDFLNELIKNVRHGYTLKQCYSWLADKYQQLSEQEYEYQNSDEYISESLEMNDYEFTENGEIYIK